jgi:hypothetical protein
MLVKSQCFQNRVIGLYVGRTNIRRHFPRKIEAINLQLDHLLIQCVLPSQFWNGEPQICDPRLCLWLESKQSQRGYRRSSVPLFMNPSGDSGEDSFVMALAVRHPRKGAHGVAIAMLVLEKVKGESRTAAA